MSSITLSPSSIRMDEVKEEYPFPPQLEASSSSVTLQNASPTPPSIPPAPERHRVANLEAVGSRPGMRGRASTAFRSSRRGEEGRVPAQPTAEARAAPSRRPGVMQRGSTLLTQGSIIIENGAKAVWRELFKDVKNDGIAMAGEFVGTVLFLLISLGAVQTVSEEIQLSGKTREQQNTATRLLGNYYTASAFGFGLYATSSIFYRFTGSIFNPSVSLALMVVGVVRPVRFLRASQHPLRFAGFFGRGQRRTELTVVVSTAQLAGGITASFLLSALLPSPVNIGLTLASDVSPVRGLWIEAFATFLLVLNVLMLGTEKHLVTPHAPLGFGLTLFAIVLFSIEYTGAGINYHWIYWLGPTIGALLATAFYAFLKLVRYWEINPGQDAIEPLHDKMGPIAPGAADNPVTTPKAARPRS